MLRILLLSLLCLAVTLNPCRAQGDVVVYNSRPDFSAVTGVTQVADFDNADVFGNNTVIDQQYGSLGLDFNPFNGGSPATLSDPQPAGFNALSAPNQVQTVPFGSFDGGGGLEVVFTPPVSAVGLFLGDVQFHGSTLTLLNADGQTLASLDLLDQLGPSALQWKFLGVVSTDGDIARIRLAFASNDYVAVDDLEFTRVQITTLTRSGTPVPGGTGVFTGFPQHPVVSTTSTAFLGLGSAGEVGVYASVIPSTPTVPPNPTKVADLTTAIPGGSRYVHRLHATRRERYAHQLHRHRQRSRRKSTVATAPYRPIPASPSRIHYPHRWRHRYVYRLHATRRERYAHQLHRHGPRPRGGLQLRHRFTS